MPRTSRRHWLVFGGGLFGTGLAGALVLLTSTPAASAPPEPVPQAREVEVIAVVDGREVSRERFNLLLAARLEKARLSDRRVPESLSRSMKLELSEQLIDELLIEDAASELGLEPTEADIDESLTRFQQGFDTEAAFQEYVAGYPLGLPELRQRLRIHWLQERVAQAEAGPLSEDTVKAFYDSAPEQYDLPGKPGVRRPFEQVKEQVRADCLRFMQRRQQEALLTRLRARAQVHNHLADRVGARPEGGPGDGKPSSVLSGPSRPSPSAPQVLPKTAGTLPLAP